MKYYKSQKLTGKRVYYYKIKFPKVLQIYEEVTQRQTDKNPNTLQSLVKEVCFIFTL